MPTNLDLVDEFQQRFGEQIAFEKARDFMFEYISQFRLTLPPVAATAWVVAKKSRAGIVTPQERDQTIRHMWDYVNQCEAPGNRLSPESCVTRSLFFPLQNELGPGEEYVSEVLAWFFYFADQFEDHSDIAEELLRKVFSSEPGDRNPRQATTQS